MSKAKFSAALTESELDCLGKFLGQFPGSMNLETMDGFFSALICAPQLAPMGEVMSWVWGEEAEFSSDDEVRSQSAQRKGGCRMERHQIINAMTGLRLYCMCTSFDEIAGKGLARRDWATAATVSIASRNCMKKEASWRCKRSAARRAGGR